MDSIEEVPGCDEAAPVHSALQSSACPDTGIPSDDNPIIAELRRIRAEQSAALGNDIYRIMADSRRRQYLYGNDVVTRDKKTGRFIVIFKGTGKLAEEIERELG
jgi:hypothetical protein